jgi:hypothetical protein
MRRNTKLRAWGTALLALCVTAGYAALPTAASASNGPDPQTTNVPYLAWAGEQVRLEKCFDASNVTADNAGSFDFSSVRAEFLVEDWSGAGQAPQIEDPTVKLFYSYTLGEVCAMGDAISLDPGLARIELDVTDNAGVLGFPGWGPADPVLKHQFLAGWMTLNDPTLNEMSSSDFASTAQSAAANFLGDPSGNGEFNPGNKPGILDVHVTGNLPLNGALGALVGASSVTLPNDWAKLANALATDSNPADTNPATRWDISGDDSDYSLHSINSGCSDAQNVPVDAIDNCTGGSDTGPFSTLFGLSSANTVGPFDQVRQQDTLLSNGALDQWDAPMPAARIDVTIAQNSGGASDISGVGYLAPQSKDVSYSRDFTGLPSTPAFPVDNLYAPFYNEFIPSTSANDSDASSGIDGPANGNDFVGFLNSDPEYHFWDIAYTLANNTGVATQCLRYSPSDDPQADSPTANPGDYYQTPSGASSVVVYTDEHGEAQAQYVPGEGYYFNSLINTGGANVNADGGCDLQSLYNVPDGLGTASITATAVYPYKPVDYPSMTSTPISKSVTSLWSKTLAYFPKGTGAANNNSRIVVAHAQDIDGTPFAGEVVCFSANGESMDWFNGTVDGINLGGTSPAADPKGSGTGRVCVTTDSNGNAAVEVLESNPVSVDVIADFTNEGILRDISVDYSTAGSSGGTPPPSGGGSTPAPASNGSTPPSSSVLSAVAPTLVPTGSPAVKSNKPRIALLRLVTPARGQHYLLVRVSSGSGSAKLRLRLVERIATAGGGKARITKTRTVTIMTNRTVKILVPASVLKVKGVSLIG